MTENVVTFVRTRWNMSDNVVMLLIARGDGFKKHEYYEPWTSKDVSASCLSMVVLFVGGVFLIF